MEDKEEESSCKDLLKHYAYMAAPSAITGYALTDNPLNAALGAAIAGPPAVVYTAMIRGRRKNARKGKSSEETWWALKGYPNCMTC